MQQTALFCLLAAFWGGSFVAIKFVVTALPPVLGAAARVGVAVVALLIVIAASGKSLTAPRGARAGLVWTGFFGLALPFALLFWGQRTVSPGVAGIMNCSVPIFTYVLALAYLKEFESFSTRKTLGLLVGFVGLGLVFAPAIGDGGALAGMAAITVMAVSYAVSILITKTLLSGRHRVPVTATAFVQTASAFFMLTALSLVLEGPQWSRALDAPASAWAAVLYLGVFSTAAAFIIFNYLIREWGAVRAAAVTYLVPLISVFFDWLFFGEIPPPMALLGAVLVLSGVVLIRR